MNIGTWGGGWLTQIGYIDYAGSTVVHLVGGTLGLMAAIVIGPASENSSERVNRLDLSLGIVFLCRLSESGFWFFGWFGFNIGSSSAGTPENINVQFSLGLNNDRNGNGWWIVWGRSYFSG